jgi:hypothetical protein
VHPKSLWLQVVGVTMMLLWACGVGFLYASSRFPAVSPVGVWSTVLAAPVALGIVLARAPRRAPSRRECLIVGVATYVVAGALARGYAVDPMATRAPILALMVLIYPVAGVVWGLVVHRAAEQEYLPRIVRRD